MFMAFGHPGPVIVSGKWSARNVFKGFLGGEGWGWQLTVYTVYRAGFGLKGPIATSAAVEEPVRSRTETILNA